MTIRHLTAEDAVSPSILRVSADMRLRDLIPHSGLQGYEAYAVFSDMPDEVPSQEFLGIVSNYTVGRYPYRIFGDLLSFSKSIPVEPSAPLDVLYSDFQQNRYDAFSVMESGQRFIGAVTLTSLLNALWHREQFLTARLQQEISNKIFVERQLQLTKKELDEYLNKGVDDTFDYKQQVKMLSETLKSVEKRERHVLATELHDHLAQLLAVGRMKLAEGNHLTQNSELLNLLNTVDHLLHESLTYTRTLMTELSSIHLHQSGLRAALEGLAEKMKRFNLDVSLEIEHPIPDLSEDQQFHIYWSLRELLFNVIKHAHVPEAGIMMQRVHETCLQFIVSDAGSGFDPATTEMRNSPHEHFGLSGIQGRMAALQGAVTIHSSPGKGTRAVLTIPLPHHSSPNRSSV